MVLGPYIIFSFGAGKCFFFFFLKTKVLSTNKTDDDVDNSDKATLVCVYSSGKQTSLFSLRVSFRHFQHAAVNCSGRDGSAFNLHVLTCTVFPLFSAKAADSSITK